MFTINKIFELMDKQGYTQQALSDYLGIKKSVISEWKSGKSKSYRKYLNQISDFLGVNVDYLLEDERRNSAIQKFGFCYTDAEINEQKALSRNKISSGNLSDEEIINEAINIYKALFSRSLIGSNYSLQHVNFEDYCAMMLNQEQRAVYGALSDEKFTWLKNKLIERFGCKKGIDNGTYYTLSEKSNIVMKKIPYSESGTTLIPLVGRVAAGYTCHAEENIVEYIHTDSSRMKQGYAYFWLQVKGDSMQPSLLEGDLVLVQKQETLEGKCYAVVTVDGEDGLVKIVDIENNKITLISVNPYYPPRVFEKEDMNRVRIIGKVVQIRRDLI